MELNKRPSAVMREIASKELAEALDVMVRVESSGGGVTPEQRTEVCKGVAHRLDMYAIAIVVACKESIVEALRTSGSRSGA